MGFLTTRYATCPSCGKPIDLLHRVRKCSVSGDLCCNRCMISGRFAPKTTDKVPPEYREKFRIFNIVPLLVVATLLYWLLATAWPSFIGWDTTGDLTNIIMDAGRAIGIWLICFIVLYPISANLPHLGNWMWFWWIEKPENRAEVEKAIKQKAKGEYQSDDKLYNFKISAIEWIKEYLIEKNIIYYISIVLSVFMLIAFFVIKSDNKFASTAFSAFAGFIMGFLVILNITVIWIASAFYSKKKPENQKNRLIIENLSWSYVFLIPLSTLLYVLGVIAMMDLTDELPPDLRQPFNVLYQVFFVLRHVVAIGLNYYLTTLEPDYNWKENDLYEEKSLIMKTPFLKKVKRILKAVLIIALLLGLIVILVLAHELIMVDFAMLFCVASYFFLTAYFVLIFALLKLVKRKKSNYFKYKARYWTLVKVSALIIIINLLPTIMTVNKTNPNLENQFSETFGSDWESKISEDEYQYLPEVAYSMFDQYYGYDIPINAQYENVYMYDSPRFVKNATTGEIISNGSSKYTEIQHPLIFDAYLPAEGDLRVNFGDSGTADTKYPVVIYVHGIGMDRGSGNANWSSQYIANQGYAVFDMSYGFTGMADHDWTGGREKGYDFPDMVKQIGNFTKYLTANADYFHVDMSSVYFAGRSFGGWLCMNLAWLYNTTFAGGNFSNSMHVSGVMPYYPATDIPGIGSEAWQIGEYLGAVDEGAPYIRGSSNPEDSNYNPEWKWYNALWQAENSEAGTLAPVFGIQGTHDYLVPQGAMKRLESYCEENGHPIVAGYYPFGSHGFDAIHFSHYGQSILYYMLRFMALTN